MHKLVFVGTIMAAVSAHNQGHPVHRDLVEDIKAKATTWFPMEVEQNPLFKMSTEQVIGLLGTNVVLPVGWMSPPVDMTGVPDSFDSRVQWPDCIHDIRDQQSCGSCWAFAATEAFSDRWCIASDEKINVILSPEDMVECDTGDYGCNGGYLDRAWDFLELSGVVTEACLPYVSGSGVSPVCATECTTSS
jgi:C1A family cysteine protease